MRVVDQVTGEKARRPCGSTPYQLRRELIELYFDQGTAGMRDHIDGQCPGCVTDLLVGYVVANSQGALEAEFGSD
jgi:hypothetical protein